MPVHAIRWFISPVAPALTAVKVTFTAFLAAGQTSIVQQGRGLLTGTPIKGMPQFSSVIR